MLAPRHSRMPLILRLFSSVWFGITMLALILIYASIFSALPQIRGALELTEMAAFQHWLFTTMIVLFTISLVTVTLVRIRWSVINLGVLTVHSGLVLLVIGSTWYFYTKVEGDTLLLSPRVEVLGPTGTPLRGGWLLCEPGSDWSLNAPMLGGEITLNVTDVQSSADAGPHSATVSFSDQTHADQELTLSINKITRLNQQLSARLVVADPVTQFFDNTVPALDIRALNQDPNQGSDQDAWRQYEIQGLPIFRERFLEQNKPLLDRMDRIVRSKRTTPHIAGTGIWTGWYESWRMPIEVPTPEFPFDVRITGYLPYIAGVRNEMTPNGPRQIPVIEPIEIRRPNMGRYASAVQLEMTGRDELAGWQETHWVMFSAYTQQDARPLRITPQQGDKSWELLYTRFRRPLEAALIPQKLSVTLFPGRANVESWRSDFLVATGDQPPVQAAVYTNQTYVLDNWTLFQSGAAQDHWSHTVLGVGNRQGILLMLIACTMITLGCLYAFYVKPVLIRRQYLRGAESRASRQAVAATSVPHPSIESQQPQESQEVLR